MTHKRTVMVFSACALAIGLVAGHMVWRDAQAGEQGRPEDLLQLLQRFNGILTLVKYNYVDELESEVLIDDAIEGMLSGLDPHTNYLKPEAHDRMQELNRGEYSGIGIAFDILDDILTVISPIEGSPSWDLGIKTGDQIVEIEGESAIGITQSEVFEKLRGPAGTKVRVGVRRAGEPGLLYFTITRANIAIKSVSYYFMMSPGTGYIRANRFSAHTADEMEEALDALETQGMERLLLDLRGNTGGFLNQAIQVADKFIDGDKLIVYTKGRTPDSNEEYYSSDSATHDRFALIVLIDQASASASEIVSGAVQDWDRGLIVGNTSFGKGLVQRQFPLRSGGSLLLTVAKYYTPSGRLIQRSYEGQDRMSYVAEAHEDRSLAETDSALALRPKYETAAGRPVYGGGGITPDIRITHDYSPTDTQRAMLNPEHRYFFEFANAYVDRSGNAFGSFEEFLSQWHISDALFQEFVGHITKVESELTPEAISDEREFVDHWLRAEIAGKVWGTNERYHVIIDHDPMVREALGLFPHAELLARGDVAGFLQLQDAVSHAAKMQ